MTRIIGYTVYTQNVRYDNRNPVEGELLWEKRMPSLVSSIRFHASTNSFVCLQEVLHHQLEGILKELGPEWRHVGVGRDDGIQKGEYAPILYRSDEWDLVDSQTYWLSPTPEKPSRGWDAALPRIVTFAKFKSQWSGGIVNLFNTHFDHQGVIAREESAKLIIKLIEAHGKGATAVLTGDFNSESTDAGYKYMKQYMEDACLAVSAPAKYGHNLSYTGFNKQDRPSRIDFVWLTKDIHIRACGILHSEFHGFKFSDHRPVMVRIEHKLTMN